MLARRTGPPEALVTATSMAAVPLSGRLAGLVWPSDSVRLTVCATTASPPANPPAANTTAPSSHAPSVAGQPSRRVFHTSTEIATINSNRPATLNEGTGCAVADTKPTTSWGVGCASAGTLAVTETATGNADKRMGDRAEKS